MSASGGSSPACRELEPDDIEPMRSQLLKTAILAGLAGNTHAQTTWNGNASQEWTDPANWSAGVPGTNSRAYINTAEANRYAQINSAVAKTSTVGGNDLWIGDGNTTGRLDINNAGSLDTSGTWMFIGNGGGTGTLNVNSGGSLVSNADVRFNQGVININGGSVNVARIVGTGGTSGALNVSGAGSLTTTNAGTSNGSPDLQNLAVSSFSGSISAARNANFRNGATSGMSGGTLSTAGEIRIGNSGSHTFSQSAGTVSTGTWMVVGIGAGGNGVYELSGGNVNASTINGSAFSTIGAAGGVGRVDQSGGTWYDPNKTVLGENAGGSGTYNLNGGILRTGRVETLAGSGSLNLNGGTLRAIRNEGNFISANTTVSVQAGGANIDSDGFNITVGANLSGAGTLDKEGAGSLNLTGTGNSVGAASVSAGTLFISGALTTTGGTTVSSTGAIGAGDADGGSLSGGLTIADGGKLDLSLGKLTLASGSTLSFGGFGFDDLVGFDVNLADFGLHTLVEGGFTLDSSNISHFGAENALDLGGGRSAYFTQGSLAVMVVPEPSSALLAGFGLAGLTLRRRRKC
jgi:hypothetical protein